MSSAGRGRLYDLLPVVYRLRDADRGEPLRALLGVIEAEVDAVEADIDGLYENWFIETCQDWVAPYIGDLLGVRALHAVTTATLSERARVANTLGYRRRKGTLSMLEQLARDVTDWPARAVEFFQLLGTTQHLNHLRPANLRTPDIRDSAPLELQSTPFDRVAHSADVRRIDSGKGLYNVPNVGLFLWRLQSYVVEGGDAPQMGTPPDGRFTFNPLGIDAPLFGRPATETSVTALAGEENVPAPVRRRALYDDVEAVRQALADGLTPRPRFFGSEPVISIEVDGEGAAVPAEQILVCDLSDPATPIPEGWSRPPTSKAYRTAAGTEMDLPIRVAVDPVLGRLAFPSGVVPERVRVGFAYGFPGDIGGGPYDRTDSASAGLVGTVDWQIGVSSILQPVPGQIVATVSEAVEAWSEQPPGTIGVIALMDGATHAESLTGTAQVSIPAGSQLLLVGADWPEIDDPDVPGRKVRPVGRFAPVGMRPHVKGDLSVRGTAAAGSPTLGAFAIDGLLIQGQLTVLAGSLGRLRIAHTTIVPGVGGVRVNPSSITGQQNESLTVSFDHSICGPVALTDSVPRLVAADSIVDAGGGAAISATGTGADLQRCTVAGSSSLRSLEASDSVFTGPVVTARRQVGCVRFSFVPAGSVTPRRYRCQPDTALDRSADPAQRALVEARLVPSFTSLRYGDPAYAQLGREAPDEITAGAENGAEMGAWNQLRQPQREANLRASLDEYLRFGLEAGMFFVT